MARGLDPHAVRLVTADGVDGIAAAVAEVFPEADLQRCWPHRIRNLLDAIPLAERRACLRGLRTIYRARTRRAAVAAYWRWATHWRMRHPHLVRRLEADLDDLLAVFAVPAPIRLNLRSTNLIERAFRVLRRRLRPIGALPDRRSADRILYARCSDLTSSSPAAPSRHSHKRRQSHKRLDVVGTIREPRAACDHRVIMARSCMPANPG